jgi:hypothetical protein
MIIASLGSPILLLALAVSALAQPAPPATAPRVDSIIRTYLRLARDRSGAIWPGFRPDTMPVAVVVGGGTLLFNWTGSLPPGFATVAGLPGVGWRDSAGLGAASTGTRIGDRGVAQVAAGAVDPADLIPTAFHEAFHVYQASQRREGRRFGAGENSFHVVSYPIFDPTNEALFAIETRVLATALEARDRGRRRELARQFVAVRRERLRRLATEYAEFDRASELNEGLAEYALQRGLELMAADPLAPSAWRSGAAARLRDISRRLREVTSDSDLSFRLRYYHTGPAIARLLDQLSPAWKTTFAADNLWLEDALARAGGIEDAQQAAFRAAVSAFDSAAAGRQAVTAIEALQRRRRLQVDSLLATPGILLVVRADSLPSRDFNLCGFDPQNLLQVSHDVRLQTRWWRPCSGGPTTVELGVPSVLDAGRGTLSGVIGPESEIVLTRDGKPLPPPPEGDTLRDIGTFRLRASRASLEAARADITRSGRSLIVWPKGSP